MFQSQTTEHTERAAAPGPPRQRVVIPTPWETAVALWLWLRRMSTALLLLFVLAAAAVVATFVPQEPVTTTTVAEWRTGESGPGAEVAAVLDAIGLFDVFGAWWFMLLLGLLVLSLTGCLWTRVRAFVRVYRRPPAGGRNLERLRNHAVLHTGLEPAEVLDAADRVLERRHFRRRRLAPGQAPTGQHQLAAERGRWREGGSILFHVSFYVILAGAVIAHGFGFEGQVNVVEGDRFAETRISYGAATPGRWFPMEAHRGFVVELDDFSVAYHDDPQADDRDGPRFPIPRDFVSTITFSEDGAPVRTEQVRVNHPVRHDGMTLYQVRFGFAPSVLVRNEAGVELYDDAVIMIEEGPNVWTGVAKVAAFEVERQLALELVLLPDAAFTADGVPFSRTPEPHNPRLVAVLWFGELGLERNIPARQFDRDSGQQLPQPLILAPGETGTFEDLPLEVAFTDLPYWSGFQVSHERGRILLLLGGVLLLGGLLPSLYSYRRRVWVDVRDGGGQTTVVIAGVALQRKAVFETAFAGLVRDLEAALPAGHPDPQADAPARPEPTGAAPQE